MKFWWCVFLLLACGLSQASAPDASYHSVNTRIGSDLQIALPLTGLALTWFLKPVVKDLPPAAGIAQGDGGLLDWNHLSGSPRHDLFLALGRTEAVTYGLKYSVDARRPNGGTHSFPSGHTSASFLGAEFLRKEYGPWYGAPAYLAASYVGWTRQQSRNHYTRDVFAGAAVGILSNHDLSELRMPYGDLSLGVSLLAVDGAEPLPAASSVRAGGIASLGLVPGLGVQWRF